MLAENTTTLCYVCKSADEAMCNDEGDDFDFSSKFQVRCAYDNDTKSGGCSKEKAEGKIFGISFKSGINY